MQQNDNTAGAPPNSCQSVPYNTHNTQSQTGELNRAGFFYELSHPQYVDIRDTMAAVIVSYC